MKTAERHCRRRRPCTVMCTTLFGLCWYFCFCFCDCQVTDTDNYQPILLPKPKRSDKCGLYLAESTIPGAGMGIFAGHASFEPGEMVTDSDLVIPVFELDWHNQHKSPLHFLWSEYVWAASTFDGMDDQEVEPKDAIHACSPGMGAAVNCRLNMVNLEDTPLLSVMGRSGVPSESPGAGAFTPYYGRQFRAIHSIPPGMELYVNYGEKYFATRSAYQNVPMKKNYRQADRLLERFQSLQKKVPALNPPTSRQVSEALYQLIAHDFPFKSRTIHALPSDGRKIDAILHNGGTSNITYEESIRSLEWLEEHGSCMDNLKDGVSTLPHAGRGAFANRFIPQGGLVAPMPLIHIGNRHMLTMYEASLQEEDDGSVVRDVNQPVHQQLLLNYCFGHRETTLLLCPYGLLTSLINHSHEQPNAYIQWSRNLRHPEWLNQTYLAWHRTKHSGLSFDVVAMRDIQEDEEILIDYGLEWETAWKEHVMTFDAPRREYTPAFEMNIQIDLQIKTIHEKDYESIDGIYTFCRKHMVDLALGQKHALRDNKKMTIEVEDLEEEGCYPCRVVHRNHNDSYIAELFSRVHQEHPSGLWEVNIDTVESVLLDVPRDTFYFHDAFYSRDHHQEWSFRHDMRLPDHLLPDAWRRHASKLSRISFEQDDAEDDEDDDEDDDDEDKPRTKKNNEKVDTTAKESTSETKIVPTTSTKGQRRTNNLEAGAAREL